ncbi:MAG: hypothetical protein U0163_20960 [Gemmatimonadaceae bacterium]
MRRRIPFAAAPVVLAAVWLATVPAALQAQRRIVNEQTAASGGFGGPVIRVSRVAGEAALFVGARGAWLLNHRVAIGAGGYKLAGEQIESHFLLSGETTHLEYTYGGFELEYFLAPLEPNHASLSILVGVGGANWATKGRDKIDSDQFVVVEPGASLERRLASNVQVAAGVAYRIVGGARLTALTAKDLGGPTIALTCKIGVF